MSRFAQEGVVVSLTDVNARPSATAPREWWEVLAERRARWFAGHPVMAQRLRLVRTVVAWLAPVYLLVMVWLVPDVRGGLRVWAGTLWVVLAWFLLARTKTLTWPGLMRFFSVCTVWSAAVGVVLGRVSAGLGGFAGLGQGAPTFVAGIGEEALKVVPVVALAVVAPRRFSRLAAVDFVVLGLVAGAAFEAVEEAVRRTVWAATASSDGTLSRLAVALADVGPDGLPAGYVRYGWWPLPAEMAGRAWGTGDPVVFAGHAVTTALVAGTAGLAVVAWRSVRTRSVAARVVVRAVALVVPALVLVTMMSDHLATNARLYTGDDWLAPGSTVPWWLAWPWQHLGQGQYRPAVLALLLVVCLAVDALRLAARPGTNLVPGPAWAWVRQAGASLHAWHARTRWPGQMLATALDGLLATVWITGRDLGQVVLAHTREAGEPRLAAARRGPTAVATQRALREVGMDAHASPVRPWRVRLVAVGLLAGLLAATLVLAPHLAAGTGPHMQGGWDWLAGLLDSLAQWWNRLDPGVKLAIIFGVALIIGAMPFATFGAAFWVTGIAAWSLDHYQGIKTFAHDPQAATRSYGRMKTRSGAQWCPTALRPATMCYRVPDLV